MLPVFNAPTMGDPVEILSTSFALENHTHWPIV